MVYRRGGRFGVCTSRTLRKSHSRLSHTRQFSISKFVDSGRGKHFTIDRQFQEIVPDGGIEVGGHSANYADFPAYSLNKRKRWCLPRLLKDAILDSEEIDELPFKVSVVERAPMPFEPVSDMPGPIKTNVADCKMVTRSHTKERTCEPKRGHYSFETDLRADRRRTKFRGMIYLNSSEEDEETEEQWGDRERNIPELVYEICYPRPQAIPRHVSRCQVYHPYSYRPRSCQRIQDKKVKALSIEQNRKHIRACCREQTDLYSDGCWSRYFCDRQDKSPADSETLESLHPSDEGLCLGDFVRAHPLKKKSWRQNKERNQPNSGRGVLPSDNRDLKSRKVYLDVEDNGSDGQERCNVGMEYSEAPTKDVVDRDSIEKSKKVLGGDSSNPYSPSSDSGYSDSSGSAFTFDPVTHAIPWQEVRLQVATLEEANLARTFGESLMDFAASDPFCVAINLCRVKEYGDVGLGESRKSDEVVLLIQRLQEENMTTALCRFRAFHLKEVQGQQCSIDTTNLLDSQQIYTVSDLVRLIQYAVSQVLRSAKEPKRERYKKGVCLPTVSGVLGWQYQCKSQDEVVGEIIYQHEVSAARPLLTYRPCAAPVLDRCEICCDDITDTEGGRPPARALSKCSHWFCGTCWQHYVTSRTHQGDVNIICPAMDCDTPVDKVTLLSLLPDALLPLYQELEHNRLLRQQKTWEWCQNPHCGRMVASVEGARHGPGGDDRMNVVCCDCGYSWCQLCKEAVHWPATCQQATEYQGYIDKTGTDKGANLIMAVEVKRCPNCDYPVEKSGGCMHMVCSFCRQQYCWECLSDWVTHDWSSGNCAIQPMESVSLSGRTKMSIEAYLRAASERRKERRMHDIDKMTSAALKTGIRTYFQHLKTLRRDHPRPRPFTVTAESEWPYTTTWLASVEERNALTELIRVVHDAVNIYREIGFVLEYLNVLIATSTTRELRLRRSGWRDTMDRLSFISLRLYSILSGESMLRHPYYRESLQRLVTMGRQRLREVVKAIPRVHNLLAVKNRQWRKTSVTNSKGKVMAE